MFVYILHKKVYFAQKNKKREKKNIWSLVLFLSAEIFTLQKGTLKIEFIRIFAFDFRGKEKKQEFFTLNWTKMIKFQ